MERSKVQIVGLIAIILIVAVCTWFWHWASQKQLGIIKASPHYASTATLADQAVSFNSSYFTMTLRADMQLKSSKESSNPIALQQILWAAKNEQFLTPQADQLAITVGKLPKGGLKELSAVQARQKVLKNYKKVDLAGVPKGSICFERLDATVFEKTVFFTNGTLYASVSATATKDRQQAVNAIVSTAISSWHWK